MIRTQCNTSIHWVTVITEITKLIPKAGRTCIVTNFIRNSTCISDIIVILKSKMLGERVRSFIVKKCRIYFIGAVVTVLL
jgi:hypothetical protein